MKKNIVTEWVSWSCEDGDEFLFHYLLSEETLATYLTLISSSVSKRTWVKEVTQLARMHCDPLLTLGAPWRPKALLVAMKPQSPQGLNLQIQTRALNCWPWLAKSHWEWQHHCVSGSPNVSESPLPACLPGNLLPWSFLLSKHHKWSGL